MAPTRAHLPPSLLPRVGPPPVAECDSMACGELCCWRQNTASGTRTEQQIDHRKEPFMALPVVLIGGAAASRPAVADLIVCRCL